MLLLCDCALPLTKVLQIRFLCWLGKEASGKRLYEQETKEKYILSSVVVLLKKREKKRDVFDRLFVSLLMYLFCLSCFFRIWVFFGVFSLCSENDVSAFGECVRACVRACARARVRVYVCVCV